jgi:hypothetical protein
MPFEGPLYPLNTKLYRLQNRTGKWGDETYFLILLEIKLKMC